ncbi:shikimate dehydrogenase [Phenylobacterium immobile]|uniref:shikimate dehydrogenase n=1 Tax=Phenylobacterium immobile TaxID=21 RepID=UPI000A852FE6|nr:shikimate dehydrogenase [Phenylobacterium immobile]
MKAAVVGNPIAHSLSPLIHGAWLKAGALDGTYERVLIPLGAFPAEIHRLQAQGLSGVNVTLPFKEEALALADEPSPRAVLAGAANLLVFGADGRICADNTDGEGMLGAVAAQAPGFDLTAAPVLMFGAGGAARGAAAALVAAGAPSVVIVNRTLARAEAIAAELGPKVRAFSLGEAAALISDAGLIVNATSAGLAGQPGFDFPLDRAPRAAVAMDMVYKPLITPFLAQAADLGLRTVDGLEMLIRQAVPSFAAFFGQAPDLSVDVRGLCLAALEPAS